MPTSTLTLTDRQRREREYYDEFSSNYNIYQKIDFSPVISKKRRVWNSYWSVYHLAQDYHAPGARMLDFGSGPGDNALRFARLGYKVDGFDISEENVKLASKLFEVKGQVGRGSFMVAPAEKLPYADETFDFIAGIDILHHIDIYHSLRECHRVLKKGGVAVFREPLEVPYLDKIRNTRLMKSLFPKKKSFDLHITEDERKLNRNDLEIIKGIFPNYETRHFSIFARLDRFFRKPSDPSPSFLEMMDYYLIRYFPFLSSMGGAVIFIFRKTP